MRNIRDREYKVIKPFFYQEDNLFETNASCSFQQFIFFIKSSAGSIEKPLRSVVQYSSQFTAKFF